MKLNHCKPFFAFLLILSCSLSNHTFADNFKFSGFGTLGLTHGGDDDLYFRRDLSQDGQGGGLSLKTDSILGLQLNANLTPKLHGALQLLFKDRSAQNLDHTMKWAFLGYQLNPNWTVRAGRMAVDIHMLSEYRDVDFAYLWARPPTEFYAPLTVSEFDGADAVYSTPFGDGIFLFKLFTGNTESHLSTYQGTLKIKLNNLSGVNFTYETHNLKIRTTLATSKIATFENSAFAQLTSALALFNGVPGVNETLDSFDNIGERLSYYSAGASYDKNDWVTQAEISYMDNKSSLPLSYISGYFSIGHRLGSITPYSMVASVITIEDPYLVDISSGVNPVLNNLAQASQRLFNSGQVNQDTFTLGIRWDAMPRVALKVQWDRSWVSADKARLWSQQNFPGQNKVMDTFAFNLNFIF